MNAADQALIVIDVQNDFAPAVRWRLREVTKSSAGSMV